MIEALGLPYMGSKRKLAPRIMYYIISHNPKCKYLYDLFGGGGAISFYALQTPNIKQVYYNELNTGVVELLRKIQKDGVTDEFYQWVDRDTFNKHKNDNNWFGGLCKIVWSFGNNQKWYLFGKDIEEFKRLLHEFIVNNNLDCLEKFNKHFNLNLDVSSISQKTTNERRLELQRIMSKQVKDKSALKGFCINEESSIRNISQQLERLEYAEQLIRLQRLQRLQQLEQFEISNLSYEQVEIITPVNETIIYLDPPYKNTEKYQKDIDHDELKQYIHNSPYKIYLNSYENIYDMNEVMAMSHRTTLSATANNKVTEKLFCNRIETEQTTLF